MTDNLPQKYQEVAKALIPYVPDTSHQMALITIEPALPCFICAQPAHSALIAPAPDNSLGQERPGSLFRFVWIVKSDRCSISRASRGELGRFGRGQVHLDRARCINFY